MQKITTNPAKTAILKLCSSFQVVLSPFKANKNDWYAFFIIRKLYHFSLIPAQKMLQFACFTGPIVYRLGHSLLKARSGVRLSIGSQIRTSEEVSAKSARARGSEKGERMESVFCFRANSVGGQNGTETDLSHNFGFVPTL